MRSRKQGSGSICGQRGRTGARLQLIRSRQGAIRRSRGDEHPRRFVLQLCVLRKTGRFVDSYRQVPTRILTHLSRQLELSPVLFVSETERSATEYDYQERIRHYLGWQVI
jgi:TnpA family transposase